MLSGGKDSTIVGYTAGAAVRECAHDFADEEGWPGGIDPNLTVFLQYDVEIAS